MKCGATLFVVASMYLVLFACDGSSARAEDHPPVIICDFGKKPSRVQYELLLEHQYSEEYKYFDKNCNGKPDHAAFTAWFNQRIADQLHDYDRLNQAGVPVPLPGDPNPKPKKAPGGWSAYPILRDSFADVAVFSSPKDVKLASGAQLNYSRDNVGENTSWSATGVAAYPIVWQNPVNPTPRSAFDPYLEGFALTPTVTFNRLTNTNTILAKKNVNILTFGGASEFAFGHMFDETTVHYFRVRSALATDFDSVKKSWSVTGEYQPITNFSDRMNFGSPNRLGMLPATFQIDPILRIEYSERLQSTTDPLFATHENVLRAGPVLALSIAPFQGDASPVPKVLQRLNYTASYSWLRDLNRDQSYAHFLTALGFALDDSGNVGIKLSFEKGKNEETGKPADVTKVGLTAKY
jgi:hypothetical protein